MVSPSPAPLYSPNDMVKALHNFMHVGSSDFDFFSGSYRLSILFIGGFFFCLFVLTFGFLCVTTKKRPPKPTNSIFRISNYIALVAIGALVSVSASISWNIAGTGLDNLIVELDGVRAYAVNISMQSDEIYDCGQLAITYLNNLAVDCPQLGDDYLNVTKVFNKDLYDFRESSRDIPKQIDSVKPLVQESTVISKISLAVPLAFILLSAIFLLLSILFHSDFGFKIGKFITLSCFLICGIVISVEMMGTVASSDMCYDADNTIVNLVEQVSTNQTYQLVKFYSTCRGVDGSKEAIRAAIQFSVDLYQIIDEGSATCNSTWMDQAKAQIQEFQLLNFKLNLATPCYLLNGFWVRIVHDVTCDQIVPGISWLWIAQFVCLIGMIVSLYATKRVLAARSRSRVYVHSEISPLYSNEARRSNASNFDLTYGAHNNKQNKGLDEDD